MVNFKKEQLQIEKIEIRSIERREFGFEMGAKSMRSGKAPFIRKLSFRSISDIEKFISKKKPTGSFVSVAYWAHPQFACSPSGEGGWEGADYFVDIDYENNMKKAKVEAQIAQWVMTEKLGIAQESIEIYFSGCKGYHVVAYNQSHEYDGKTLKMNERKVLANYFVKLGVNHLDKVAFCNIHGLRRIPGTVNSKSGKLCRRCEV